VPPRSRRSRVGKRLVPLLRSRVLRLVFQVVVLGLVLWLFVLPRLIDALTQGSLRAISGFGWPLAAVGAQVVSLGCYALMTRSVLTGHPHRPPFPRLLAIDLTSIAVTNTVPVGAAAGTGVGVRLLAREGVRPAEATSAKLLQGIVAALALILLTAVAFAVQIVGPGLRASDLTSLRIGGPVLIGVLAVILALAVLSRTRTGRRAARVVAGRVPTGIRPPVLRVVRALGVQIGLLVSQPRVLLPTVTFGAANWLADALSLWCCVHAFGNPPVASGLLLSFGLATAVGWLPLTPGGVGVVEAVLIPGLIGLGGSHGAAVLGVLTWRLVHSWLPVPLGLVARISISRRALRVRGRLLARVRARRSARQRRRRCAALGHD
jgi:uncharacterized protein (TIRG00374 family)